MVSNFSKSSQAWKDRLKLWAYTCTFVALSALLHLLFFSLYSCGVIRNGKKKGRELGEEAEGKMHGL